MKERWADQTQALISGESLAKAAKRCGVATTTTFRWRHRFVSAPALDKPQQLTGIVEADERMSWNCSRESAPAFRGRRTSAAAWRRPEACPASKSRFWSRVTGAVRPPMRTGQTRPGLDCDRARRRGHTGQPTLLRWR
jgi:hypothetical protein